MYFIITPSSNESSMGSKPILAAQFRVTVHAPSEQHQCLELRHQAHQAKSTIGERLHAEPNVFRKPGCQQINSESWHFAHRDKKCTEYTRFALRNVFAVRRWRRRWGVSLSTSLSLLFLLGVFVDCHGIKWWRKWKCVPIKTIYTHYESEWRGAQTIVD